MSPLRSSNLDVLVEEAKKIQAKFDQGLFKVSGRQIPSTPVIPYEHSEPRCKLIDLPLCTHTVAAGSPTDSQSVVDEYMSLPAYMVKHPGKTFAVKASGDSMIGAGIQEGDILIVDKARDAKNKNIVIASINGEQTVKRLMVKKGVVSLAPENPKYHPIELTPEMDFRSLGVVIS
jgi:DNA polymerase V